MRWLLLLCLAGCLDYDALTHGPRDDLSTPADLSVESTDLAAEDFSLAPPDLTTIDLAGADLVGADLAGAAPQLIGASTMTHLGSTTCTVPSPGGTQKNDLILLMAWWSDPTRLPAVTGEVFHELASATVAGSQTAHWYWRIADDANEGNVSYTLTFNAAIDSAMMAITFRGATTAVAAPAMVRIMSDWPASVTTTVANTAIVPAIAYSAPAGGWTPPTGFSPVGNGIRTAAFITIAAAPQIVSISKPLSGNNLDPLLTDVLLVQP